MSLERKWKEEYKTAALPVKLDRLNGEEFLAENSNSNHKRFEDISKVMIQ